jgi:hypothetical protein
MAQVRPVSAQAALALAMIEPWNCFLRVKSEPEKQTRGQ